MSRMKYISVCSGIEAATVAWHHLGWEPAWFSEIEPFPCSVLKHHYPNVPNLGDMTKWSEWPDETIDVLVGGTPCQSFSVAGLRQGLEDPRGNLALTFLAIANKYKPRYIVWENVPGVLSSNKGKDFASFLDGLEAIGYVFDVDILDAQFFGLAQRRRRVFVCAQSVDSLLAKKTISSALIIAQCLSEILHGILAETLKESGHELVSSVSLSLSRGGIARRMRLFGLLTEECNFSKLQSILTEVLQKCLPERRNWELPSGEYRVDTTLEDLLLGSDQGNQSSLTGSQLSKVLEEVYDLMKSFTTSTSTKKTTALKICSFFSAGAVIGRLICRLSGLCPRSSGAMSSFLILHQELTNYARKTSGELFSGLAGFSLHANFIRQAERIESVVGHLGDWRRAAAVLFERKSLCGNSAKGGKARKGIAGTLSSRTTAGGGLGTDFELAGGLQVATRQWPAKTASTLYASFGSKLGLENQHINEGAPLFVLSSGQAGAEISCDRSPALTCLHEAPIVLMDQGGSAMNTLTDGTVGTLRLEMHGHEPCVLAFAQNQLGELRTGEVFNTINTNSNASGRNVPMVAFSSNMSAPDCQTDGTTPTLKLGGHGGGNPPAIVLPGSGKEDRREDSGVCPTLKARMGTGGGSVTGEVAMTLKAGQGNPAVNQPTVMQAMQVRRLTPIECERLQGFPDNYTNVSHRGKPAADGPRYKALGNSMAVPCMRWIGERIQMVEAIKESEGGSQ